jgi:hypothetical protein
MGDLRKPSLRSNGHGDSGAMPAKPPFSFSSFEAPVALYEGPAKARYPDGRVLRVQAQIELHWRPKASLRIRFFPDDPQPLTVIDAATQLEIELPVDALPGGGAERAGPETIFTSPRRTFLT